MGSAASRGARGTSSSNADKRGAIDAQRCQFEEAGSLALGQQRILEIARALCCDPTLLLLDEPAAGLRYKEKQALAELLKKLKAGGMSILLVEQNARAALQVADCAYVLETGDVVLEGPAEKLANDPKVIDTYLGLTRKTQE